MAVDSTKRAAIRVLPPLVVDQIAAGEVVERPASVVKELLDNAIDAGAGRIVVEVEAGGVELVRVTDDGAGIPADELPLAVHPHATSKIASTADLDRVATMGFRGEALASIASVARLAIRSRTADAEAATALRVEGGRAAEPRPEAGPVGTQVTVRNLFFNTPARRKFLRTPQTEQGHCTAIVRTLALSHPAIGFSLAANGRAVLEVPAEQSPRERAFAILGREHQAQYLELHADDQRDERGAAVWGLVGLPALARSTTARQHVFLNGRPIRDRSIQHALREAFRGLVAPGLHPAALVMVDLPPGAVDVNVHPAKTEVRFRDRVMVHALVGRAVRDALAGADLTRSAAGGHAEVRFRRSAPEPRLDDLLQRSAGFDIEPVRAAIEAERRTAYATEQLRATRRPDLPGQTALPPARPADRFLRVHGSYLVLQDEQGIVIVDQHALHERVMFERLRARIAEAGRLASQRLLVPAPVSASPARQELIAELGPLLERLGIEAEPIGPAEIAVRAFPVLLLERGVEPAAFVADLLERTEAEGGAGGEEAALHEVLDTMACKAAVKAGDTLTDDEIADLLRQRDEIDRAASCPHGRPTTIRLTIAELERQFGR